MNYTYTVGGLIGGMANSGSPTVNVQGGIYPGDLTEKNMRDSAKDKCVSLHRLKSVSEAYKYARCKEILDGVEIAIATKHRMEQENYEREAHNNMGTKALRHTYQIS